MPTIPPGWAGALSIIAGAAVVAAAALQSVPTGSDWTAYAGAAALAISGYFHLTSPSTAGPLGK